LKVYGVSFDTVEDNQAFAEKFSFNFPLLCDTDRAVGVVYGAADERGSGGFARRISVLIGPDGKVLRVYPKVDVKNHPEQVLEDL
jgi:peroxiredoxin Q/BCP